MTDFKHVSFPSLRWNKFDFELCYNLVEINHIQYVKNYPSQWEETDSWHTNPSSGTSASIYSVHYDLFQ